MIDWSLLSGIFKYVIIILLYTIIIVALIIMYRDIRRPKKQKKRLKEYALEVVKSQNVSELPVGAIIPVDDVIKIGRKHDNNLIIEDEFVSSYHNKIYMRQNSLIVQDLKSTNGTYVNSSKIKGEALLNVGDIIRVGNTILKVIS